MKNKKGLLMLFYIFTIFLSLGLNASSAHAEEVVSDSSLEEIKEKGVLVIGTSADFPPYEFHATIDGKDTIVGMDIEIAKKIAEDIGVELEIKDMQFDSLIGVGNQ